MKKYIKPSTEIINVHSEGHMLNGSPVTTYEDVGDEWLAPEYREQKDRNVNLWDEQW